MEPDDLTMRPITGPAELGLFSQLPYVLNEELADDLAGGRRRPEWMWLALRGGRPLARAAWWTRAAGDAPLLLDILDVDDSLPGPARLDIGERLLRTAMAATVGDGSRPPGYGRFVPPDWHDSAASTAIVGDRMTIAERTGARLLVERLNLEWRPGAPVPGPTGRLLFRPVRDTGELLELMTLVLDGTLDAHHRDDLTRMSARETADAHYRDELGRYGSPREWWRIATLPGGEPVGFATVHRIVSDTERTCVLVIRPVRASDRVGAGARFASADRVPVVSGGDVAGSGGAGEPADGAGIPGRAHDVSRGSCVRVVCAGVIP